MRITFRVRPRRTLARFSSDARARFAGRYALGKHMPAVETKQGMRFAWRGEDRAVRVLGGASSEILGGANLAEVLRDGFELAQRAFVSYTTRTQILSGRPPYVCSSSRRRRWPQPARRPARR